MRNALMAFGIVAAIGLVAIPTASVVSAAVDQFQDTLHPATYQLTFELDGQYYITDFNMSRKDCYQALAAVRNDPDSFRNGDGRYTCDRAPLLEPAA